MDSLRELFVEQLQDLYDAEHQLMVVMPDMIERSTATELRSALRDHLQETRKQQTRLERAFKELGERPMRKTCKAMLGLVAEARDTLEEAGDEDVRDAAIIAAAQRIEHYEIAGYGTAATYAKELGEKRALKELKKNLDEEKSADKTLTGIAKGLVNLRAQVEMSKSPSAAET